MDHQTWSALKRFIERTLKENFERRLPEPRRKKVRHAADRNENNEDRTQKEADNTKGQANALNYDEMETDYEDYSNLDPILPLEGSPRPALDEQMARIPGLEELD